MKVRITQNCEVINEFGLTDNEYYEFIGITRILDSYFHVEQLLYILINNYNDYNNTIFSTTQEIFNDGSSSKKLLEYITKLNGKLLNVSSSFRCYRDQLLGNKDRGRKGIFEELLSDVHEKIIQRYEKEKKDNDGLDYLYNFRNEIQHISLPMKILSFNRNLSGADNEKVRLLYVEIHKELSGNEYLKIGKGLQPLFNIHYEIVRKEVFPFYQENVKQYKKFFEKYIKDSSSTLSIYDEKNPDDISYPAKDYPERIDRFILQNPNRKPLTQGWVPGIINVGDIEYYKENKS